MHPTTTTSQLAVSEQLSRVPAPAAMFGVNLCAALATATSNLAWRAIGSDADRTILEAFLKEAKKVRSIASDKRLEITRILDAVKAAYTSAEKEQARELDEHITTATDEINRYLREQLAAQRAEQQRIADEQAKVLARKRSQESKAAVQVETEQLQAAAVTVPVVGVRLVWTFEIADASKVPEVYRKIDEVSIKLAIASGTRLIAGVRIFQDIARSGR